MKYDDSEYYFMDFREETPNEAAATHMGMFLAWMILKNLSNDELQETAPKLAQKRITGRDVLFDYCDGKLFDDDFNAEGNAFATWYYNDIFIHDYLAEFDLEGEQAATTEGPDYLAKVDNNWANYEKLAVQLDSRYLEWKRIPPAPQADAPFTAQACLDYITQQFRQRFLVHGFTEDSQAPDHANSGALVGKTDEQKVKTSTTVRLRGAIKQGVRLTCTQVNEKQIGLAITFEFSCLPISGTWRQLWKKHVDPQVNAYWKSGTSPSLDFTLRIDDLYDNAYTYLRSDWYVPSWRGVQQWLHGILYLFPNTLIDILDNIDSPSSIAKFILSQKQWNRLRDKDDFSYWERLSRIVLVCLGPSAHIPKWRANFSLRMNKQAQFLSPELSSEAANLAQERTWIPQLFDALCLAEGSEQLKRLRAISSPKEWTEYPSAMALAKRIEQTLAAFFTKEGFMFDPSGDQDESGLNLMRTYKAKFQGGEHRLVFSIQDHRPKSFFFAVDVHTRLGLLAQAIVEQSLQQVIDDDAPEIRTTAFLPQVKWLGTAYGVGIDDVDETGYLLMHPADVAPALAHLRHHMETRLSPLLRQFESLRGLDALYATSPLSHSILFAGYNRLGFLLCAELTGNARLLEICAEVEEHLADGDNEIENERNKVMRIYIAQLREKYRSRLH
ncbi:MAG: hypothetical protein K2Y28_15670 [Burkholderiaceae bacterium]|nr:hypothetical protein [Burkholderiaceae bacterium]